MQALFWRLFSAFMAVLFSVSGSLPGFISEKLENPPVESVEVVGFRHLEKFFEDEEEGYRVFFGYSEWQIYVKQLNNDEVNEYAEKFDKSFFNEHNLAVIQISAPSTAESVYIESAEEKSNVLELEYRLFSEYGMAGADVICYHTVFAVTSKFVSEVRATEFESVILPEIKRGLIDTVETDCSGNDDEETYFFSDYESWQEFKSTTELGDYEDIYDEYFFLRCNLTLVTVCIPDVSYTSQYVSSHSDDGVMKVEYYKVKILPPEAAVPAEPFNEIMFIASYKNVTSNVTSAEAVCLGILEYEEVEPHLIGVYIADSFYDEENNCSVFSDYESWRYYCESYYFTYNDDSLENAVDEDFFLKNNLAVATVTLPNLGGCDVYVNSAEENGNTAEIEYSLIEHLGVYPAAIEYGVILYAVSKDIESLTVTKADYPYYQDGVLTTVDASGGNEEEILLFKDYESWKNFKDTTAWQFTGYEDVVDEDYFDNNSLVIVFVELPSPEHDIEWIEMHGCGAVCYELTEPDGEWSEEPQYKAIICAACKRVETPYLEITLRNR